MPVDTRGMEGADRRVSWEQETMSWVVHTRLRVLARFIKEQDAREYLGKDTNIVQSKKRRK